MTAPEHHTDGAYAQPPTEIETPLQPGDDADWLPGETAEDRAERFRQLGITPPAEPEAPQQRDLGADWADQQSGPQDA